MPGNKASSIPQCDRDLQWMYHKIGANDEDVEMEILALYPEIPLYSEEAGTKAK